MYDDRVPYLEDINLKQPEADPFDPRYSNSVGVVLGSYVNPGSWRCPSAVAGFPKSGGLGMWKLTYKFNTADALGPPVGFDQNPQRSTGSVLAVSNYVQFDGRPLKLLDGRRYVGNTSAVANYSRRHNLWWSVRWPLIRDAFVTREQSLYFSPSYPHRAALQGRADLGKYRSEFERLTNTRSARAGFLGLFADGEQVDLMTTREPQQHPPGY